MNPIKRKLKLKSKDVDVIFYGRCNLEVLKKTPHDKVHMDKTLTRDLKKILFKILKKKIILKGLMKIRSNFDL
jgi:hypothetical protein